MKILQLNIQSLNKLNHKQLLSLRLVNNNINIAILSEIWVKDRLQHSRL